MDSFMPAFIVIHRHFYGLLLLLVLPLSVQADAFEINHANVSKMGEGYILDARIDYQLTPIIEEALDNGVPITFVQNIEIVRRTPLLWNLWNWDSAVWSREIRYQLRYHDLSQQYILFAYQNRNYRNFPTLKGALSTMGEITAYDFPREFTANPRGLLFRIKSELDLSALPSPMRPGAFLSRKWNLDSAWYEAQWPSE